MKREDQALAIGAALAVASYIATQKPEYATIITAIAAILKAIWPNPPTP